VPSAKEAGEQVAAGVVLVDAGLLAGPKVPIVDALYRGLKKLDKGALERQDRETLALKGPVLLKEPDRIQIPQVKASLEVLLESALPRLGFATDDQRVAERRPISCRLPACDVHVG